MTTTNPEQASGVFDNETAYEIATGMVGNRIAALSEALDGAELGSVEATTYVNSMRALVEARNKLSPDNRAAVDIATAIMAALPVGATAEASSGDRA